MRRAGIQACMDSSGNSRRARSLRGLSGEALLITELSLGHRRVRVRRREEAGRAAAPALHRAEHSKPADVTDTTLATELLLLDRCLAVAARERRRPRAICRRASWCTSRTRRRRARRTTS